MERIRAQHSYENFLLPPSPGDILSVSVKGPVVVVNVTIYRCDAFIVEPDQVRVVELPDLSLREVEAMCRQLTEARRFQAQRPNKISKALMGILGWLCDAVAFPILDALDFTRPLSADEDGLMCGGFPQELLFNSQFMRLGITRGSPVKW